jgi:hypothetical protein
MGKLRTASVRINIPSRDSQLRFWLDNFANCIAADPARFKLTPGDGAKLMQLADAYDQAYHISIVPTTRNAENIDAKDEAKAAALKVFREYANRIKDDPSISTAEKVALGMKVTDRGPRTITAIHSAPILTVGLAPDGAHVLRYADENTPHKRAKPPGVSHLDLRIFISRSSITDPDTPASDDVIVRNEKLTRNPSTIEHDAAHAGLTATYYGRWSTKSKTNPIIGPWSVSGGPTCMTVAIHSQGV